MNSRTHHIFLILFLAFTFWGCRTTEPKATGQNIDPSVLQEPKEYIHMNVNEIIYFQFSKMDSNWTGQFQLYTLNEENEKVVQASYKSADNESWNDFDLFVDALNIYDINAQNEVEGWVPNSASLPRRVFNFEVFNGDTLRTFSYQDPELTLRKYWQSQSIISFMTFVQNDLQWYPIETTENPTE